MVQSCQIQVSRWGAADAVVGGGPWALRQPEVVAGAVRSPLLPENTALRLFRPPSSAYRRRYF